MRFSYFVFLFTTLFAFCAAARADIRSAFYTTEISDLSFLDRPVPHVVEVIFDEVKRTHPNVEIPAVTFAEPSDSQTKISVRLRQTNAYLAIEFVARRAGLQAYFLPGRIEFLGTSGRAAARQRVAAAMEMRKQLMRHVAQAENGAISPKLHTFAINQIIKSAVFRPSLGTHEIPPVEWFALILLKRQGLGQNLFDDLFKKASGAGRCYLMAQFPELTNERHVLSGRVSFHPGGNELIRLVPSGAVYEEHIASGGFIQSLASIIP